MPDLGEGYKARVANNLLQNPLMFISQETLDFSQHMVFNEQAGSLEPHHVDLRVFAVQSGDGTVLRVSRRPHQSRATGEQGNQQFLRWPMQTDLGSPIESVTASFMYAVRYGYSDAVIHNDNQIRILPRDGEGQSGEEAEIWSVPAGRSVDFKDRFGNRVHRLRVTEPHTTFIVAAAGKVLLSAIKPTCGDVRIFRTPGAS